MQKHVYFHIYEMTANFIVASDECELNESIFHKRQGEAQYNLTVAVGNNRCETQMTKYL